MRSLVTPYQFPNVRYISSVGLSGGLTIMWKNGFSCEVLGSNNNMFHLLIQDDPSQPEWLLSCMYGYGKGQRKKEQWDFINETGKNVTSPWLGDLNIHLSKDNSSTSSYSDGWIKSILRDIGLDDLGFIGHEHTWTNNNLGTRQKRSRIDLALGNACWILIFLLQKFFIRISWEVIIVPLCSLLIIINQSFGNLLSFFKLG